MSRPTRIPGFAEPPATTEPADTDWSDRASRQINLRLRIQLHRRYRGLLRRLDADGFETSVTEIIHALLVQAPDDPDAIKDLVRAWRRTTAA